MNSYGQSQAAWRALVRSVIEYGTNVPGVTDPLSIGSGFGSSVRDTRELIAAVAGVEDCRNRLVVSEARPFRISFAIAQVLWALSGSDDLESIVYYQPRGRYFSDDGVTLRSAIGKRIFNDVNGDQFAQAITKIRDDKSTRRALIQIFTPEDIFASSKDVSCTGSLQFFARNGELHAVGHMRSQSALVVFPYDLFLMTMLHEFASLRAGLRPGPYWHICNSLHVYEDELPSATHLLNEPEKNVIPMPAMPLNAIEQIASVVEAEAEIRDGLSRDSDKPIDLRPYKLVTYWQDMLQALIVDMKLRSGCTWHNSGAASLPRVYKEVLSSSDHDMEV